MSSGFGDNKIKVNLNVDEIDTILKRYKKIKKYQKSSLYAIKVIDGTETLVSSLIKEAEEDPI
jgi:hypothetical protein